MTDKPIIVDNIDVSGCSDISGHVNDFGEYECLCRCIFGDGSDDYGIIGHEMCKDNPNCYYKQLKRKEQECDKLYVQLKADEEYYKEEENTLRKIIKNKEERNIELYKENNKLKADNEELKNSYTRLNSLYNDNCNFTGKLEQSLTEIKEIAETYSFTDSSKLLLSRIKQVLQKINEVANAR